MSVKTVFLPPAEPHLGLTFDRNQFARGRKSQRVVTAKNGLSFQDTGSMQLGRTNKQNNAWGIPPWTASDEKVQRVVIVHLWLLAHMHFTNFPIERMNDQAGRMALTLEIEQAIAKRCVDFVEQDSEMERNAVLTWKISKNYGYAKILTKIIYDKFRRNMASNTIAADLEFMSPSGVRQLSNRMCNTARIIFDDQDAPPGRRQGETVEYKLGRQKQNWYNAINDTRAKAYRAFPLTPKEVYEAVGAGRTFLDIANETTTDVNFVRYMSAQGRREMLGSKLRKFKGNPIKGATHQHTRKQGHRIFPLTPEQIYDLVTSGRTILDLAKEYDVNRDTIRHKFTEGKRRAMRLPPIDRTCKKKLILSMHADGIPLHEIATETGKSVAYVQCVIENYGPNAKPEPCKDCD